MDEQDKIIHDADVEITNDVDITQEEVDQEEQKITEESPITEAEKVQQPEKSDGKAEDKKEQEEPTTEEGGNAGEEIPDGDKVPGDGPNQAEIPDEKEEKVDKEEDQEDLDTGVKTDSTVQDDAKEIVDEVVDQTDTAPARTAEDLLAEIEDLKFEKETQELINNFSELVETQRAEYNRFQNDLENKIRETLTRFGIPANVDIDELKEVDPGKYQMLENVIRNAQLLDKEVTAQIKEPIIKASEDIVFRVAGAHMKKYGLTQDQYREAAATFVNIMNEVGIKDLKDDLKNKAELAVARAKMLIQDVKEPVKEVKKEIKETAKEPKQVAKKVDKKLDDYTKGLNPGTVGGAAEVNEANVMDLYFSKQGNERVAFLQKHKDLIMDQLKKKGMPYSDNKKRW